MGVKELQSYFLLKPVFFLSAILSDVLEKCSTFEQVKKKTKWKCHTFYGNLDSMYIPPYCGLFWNLPNQVTVLNVNQTVTVWFNQAMYPTQKQQNKNIQFRPAFLKSRMYLQIAIECFCVNAWICFWTNAPRILPLKVQSSSSCGAGTRAASRLSSIDWLWPKVKVSRKCFLSRG